MGGDAAQIGGDALMGSIETSSVITLQGNMETQRTWSNKDDVCDL